MGSTGGPHFVQVQNKHSTPMLIEIQQTQSGHAHISQSMGETHEIPHHNLANFEPRLRYATKGQAVGGVPLSNTLEGPQFLPQPQPLHFTMGRVPPATVEREKFDHIEERLRAIEGGGDYTFADMIELCLVPHVIIPPKFKVPDFDKYKGTACPKNHLKMYYRKMGAYEKDEKLLMHFFQESLTGAAITWYTNLELS